MTAIQATKRSPYNYKREQVHLLRWNSRELSPRFRCHRCRRDLPADQYEPLFYLSESLRENRRHLGSVQALHPNCWTCREQLKGAWVQSDLYSPSLDRYCTQLVVAAKGGAAARNLVFAISKDDVLGKFIEQRGLCAISGASLDIKAKGTVGRGKRGRLTPSIDRIDSHGNYTIGNIQIVSAVVNVMKNDLGNDEFIAICEQIAGNNMARLFQ